MANLLVSEVINTLAKQSGVDIESEGFKLFLSDPKLNELFIDDSFIKQIQSSLMTFEVAKNNPDLQKHFTGSALGGIDNALRRALKNINAPKEIMDILSGDETTLKKSEALIEAVKTHYEKPQDDADKEKILKENQELGRQVNELTETVNGFPSQIEKAQKELQTKHDGEVMNFNVTSKLSKYKFSSTMPLEDINLLVGNKISQMPYILKKTGNDIKVYQKDHPDLLAQEDNKEVTIEGILDTIVSPYLDKGGEQAQAQTETKTSKPVETTNKSAQASLESRMEAQAKGSRKSAFQ